MHLLKSARFQKAIFLFIVVAPAFAAYVLFTLYPNALSIYYSFLDWDGIGAKTFIGWDNYVRLFQDPFILRALQHNLILLVTVIPITLTISLVLADLLVNRSFAENSFYKVLYFFPERVVSRRHCARLVVHLRRYLRFAERTASRVRPRRSITGLAAKARRCSP